jgi:four helix bundle protein
MGEEQDVKSFRDLIVWHRSTQLCVAIYELTRSFPKEETFGLSSQLRRAAVSIASNIAEGSGRQSSGEFVQFLGIARGSNFEVQTQLYIAGQLGLGTPEQLVKCDALSVEVAKMLGPLIASVQRLKTTNH